jgi:aspartyl-tRNA(Asn)/glutamyl-tRNA(Gln) amidotransferase subunit B
MALEPCIGLEVHVELDTDSKMFCGCRNEFAAPPNSRCCPVCLGMPGSLPVPNRTAIEYVIRTGLALGCEVTAQCRFARKNYFYPDLPKNYQVSQYDEPLTFGGHLDVTADGVTTRIRVRRAHLEEDTGKNIHLPDGRSLVEYNRCGVPLMEVVTEPDFTSAEQCRVYLLELRSLLRYLGVSTANMEEGRMRAEPTVNLIDRETGERTPKAEVKNLASIKATHDAIEYELRRQRRAVEEGEELFQETRRWNEQQQITTTMRRKETADDYMYFPEPDLVPMAPGRDWVEEVRASIPELPAARRARFVEEHGLPVYDAEVLTASRQMADYFEAVAAASGDAKAASNWVMGDVQARLNETGTEIGDFGLEPERLAGLIVLIRKGTISGTMAKAIFPEMVASAKTAEEIVAASGVRQISDTGELEAIVEAAIAANPKAVDDVRAGKVKAVGAIVGFVMKQTQGQANPELVNEILRSKLG